MAERERVKPNPGDSRYIRRDESGRFDEVEDVGRSNTQDRERDAENPSTPGQGDRGDRDTE